MIKSKLIKVEKLIEWFGGFATVEYIKGRLEYTITIKNDDLINDFVFWFTEPQYLVHGEKEMTKKMLKQYLDHMKIEQQLMRKGLLK